MDKNELLIAKVTNYRGCILNASIDLERAIDAYLTKYMTTDENKQLDIFIFLLDRMSFDAKISAFQAILQRDNPQDFKKKYDKLMGKIRMWKDERNVFAHYSLNDSDNAVNNVSKFVRLVNFRNKIDFKEYTGEKFIEILSGILETANTVRELK